MKITLANINYYFLKEAINLLRYKKVHNVYSIPNDIMLQAVCIMYGE